MKIGRIRFLVAVDDRVRDRHLLLPHVEQGLVDQQDGVVDDDADQDDEAEERQHVERLERVGIDRRKPQHSTCGGERHRKHDDEGIDEALEEHGHDEVDDRDGDHQIDRHGVPRGLKVVGGAGQPDLHSWRQPAIPPTPERLPSPASPSRPRAECLWRGGFPT